MCELNVIEQAVAVSQTTILRDGWARGREVAVHGWIYDLHDGRLRDLGVTVTSQADTTQSAKSTVTINAYTGGTPPGNYTITVQATSTHQTQTGSISITVQ